MRAIKFRAWDKENQTMIYPEHKENDETALVTLNAWCDSENERSIIMQFIGLTDNEKEIYEGDIIRGDKFTYNMVVGFNNESASFCASKTNNFETKNCYWFYNDIVFTDGWSVIGNIYENPELL